MRHVFMTPHRPEEAAATEIVTGCCSLCPAGRKSDGLRYGLTGGRLVTHAELAEVRT
ncbi:hypothetical protein [Reyranella sp.]|uniref:hypothetical protein n=1 Tax=Reyranella sp. TaxID=1929291 RepID=UPI003D0EC2E6